MPHEAKSAAEQAEQAATSAGLRRDIGQWLQDLKAAGLETPVDAQLPAPDAAARRRSGSGDAN